jgi:hypothetical protein
MYENPISNIIIHIETLQAFLLMSGARQRCPLTLCYSTEYRKSQSEKSGKAKK